MLRDLLEPSSTTDNPASSGPDPKADGTNLAPSGAAVAEREDHLAILGRWFYGRPRLGEIFFAENKTGRWPYRRILRACSRVLGPQASTVEKNGER